MKKYINFSFIIIVLSVFDILTTQYALAQYPQMREGNPVMALVTSSLALFVLVKAIGVLFIINIYKRIRVQSEFASKVGQTIIILMMLFVVGNNSIQIASATTYGFPSPYSLEYPGTINIDGSQEHAFIGHNNYNVTSYFSFDTNTSNSGGLYYSAANKFYSNNMVRFAVLDWVHPQRMFLVFSNLDVAYTDSTGVIYEDGYYAENVWPIPGCSNCNDLHKIGVLTTLNGRMSGFVDSNGDLLLGEGTRVVKFIRSADYSKTTYITAEGYQASTQAGPCGLYSTRATITDMKSSGTNLHLIIGTGGGSNCGSGNPSQFIAYWNHQVYMGTNLIYTNVIGSHNFYCAYPCGMSGDLFAGSQLLPNPQLNTSTDIVFGHQDIPTEPVYLVSMNQTSTTDVCPSSCAIITYFDGLQIYSGYAYIASSAENKIYRFPTTIQVSSGAGYVPGQGQESTDQPDITYTTKSINSMYANYYNTSKFVVQSKIVFDSGDYPLGLNYGVRSEDYRWQFRLIDPNGVTVNSWDSGACSDNHISCSLSILNEYAPPSTGWQSGTWYVKLYEHKIGQNLVGEIIGTAPIGNLALLTTSASWTVLNASVNSTEAISNPEESFYSASNQETISLFDNYVGLMGFGINSVSKFLFALCWVVLMFAAGFFFEKSGMIGLALSTAPYTFFTYINYIPKWVFIIYIIMLVAISRVLR